MAGERGVGEVDTSNATAVESFIRFIRAKNILVSEIYILNRHEGAEVRYRYLASQGTVGDESVNWFMPRNVPGNPDIAPNGVLTITREPETQVARAEILAGMLGVELKVPTDLVEYLVTPLPDPAHDQQPYVSAASLR